MDSLLAGIALQRRPVSKQDGCLGSYSFILKPGFKAVRCGTQAFLDAQTQATNVVTEANPGQVVGDDSEAIEVVVTLTLTWTRFIWAMETSKSRSRRTREFLVTIPIA